jgi:hypothetical protein
MLFPFNDNLIFAASFFEPNGYALRFGGGNVLAHKIGFDGQLAMTAVDQNRELDAPGAPKIVQRVHSRPHSPATEQNIVHQHHRFSGYIKWDNRRLDVGGGPPIQIITVHTHIQAASWHWMRPNSREQRAQPVAQRHAATLDPDHHNLPVRLVSFGDLMRNPGQRAMDGGGVEDLGDHAENLKLQTLNFREASISKLQLSPQTSPPSVAWILEFEASLKFGFWSLKFRPPPATENNDTPAVGIRSFLESARISFATSLGGVKGA